MGPLEYAHRRAPEGPIPSNEEYGSSWKEDRFRWRRSGERPGVQVCGALNVPRPLGVLMHNEHSRDGRFAREVIFFQGILTIVFPVNLYSLAVVTGSLNGENWHAKRVNCFKTRVTFACSFCYENSIFHARSHQFIPSRLLNPPLPFAISYASRILLPPALTSLLEHDFHNL